MKDDKKENKFHPEPSNYEFKRSKEKSWIWLPRIEIVVGFVIVVQLIHYGNTIDGWKGILLLFVGLGLLFWFVHAILDLVIIHKDLHAQEINNLRRQMTNFICDSALGRVEENDLKRLARATKPSYLRTGVSKGLDDDFSLITRAWYFWYDQTGFEWQDDTICVNCGKQRREHSKDGNCPNQTTHIKE